jgi:hypothetical protein
MNLNDAQKQQVAGWIAEGLKISDIQKRIETELSLRLTYMEVRFLLDDLKVMPKDQTPPPPPPEALKAAPAQPPAGAPPAGEQSADTAPLPGSGAVQVGVDQIAKPGAMISGTVTFSDGQSGMWALDEMGRLGLGMKQKGYRPAPADVEEFQVKLQQELARHGL